MKHLLSKIPAINKILMTEEVKQLLEEYPEVFVKDIVKKETENIKSEILNNSLNEVPSMEKIIEKINHSVKKNYKYSLRRVINATGTILHTNLGRSILSESIKENLIDVAFNYSNLEFNLVEKQRGSRYVHLIDIIKRLTGAEDVLVVNNNAAAVMLTLSTLAKDKEIVVSRGELVEIGGAFRIPEIIKLSGGTIQEVGTTNKTHLKDYVNVINENTGILLKVHTSNYKIVGFTKEVTYKELADLAHEKGLVAVNDLGKKKVGIISIMTDWGTNTSSIIKELIEKTDAKGVAHEEVMEGSDDYTPAITKLNEAGADVVICCGMYNLVAPVAKQYKQINPDISIVGFSNAYSQQLIELGGQAVEGVCFPVIFFSESDDPNVKSYVEAYKAAYGNAPSALTSQAYDSVGILLTAIKDANTTDSEKVKDQLYKEKYQGVTGEIKFDEKGDVDKQFVKVTIKDGKFVKMDK